jgi:hypothetical protein
MAIAPDSDPGTHLGQDGRSREFFGDLSDRLPKATGGVDHDLVCPCRTLNIVSMSAAIVRLHMGAFRGPNHAGEPVPSSLVRNKQMVAGTLSACGFLSSVAKSELRSDRFGVMRHHVRCVQLRTTVYISRSIGVAPAIDPTRRPTELAAMPILRRRSPSMCAGTGVIFGSNRPSLRES